MKPSKFIEHTRMKASELALQRIMVKELPQPETEKRIREIWRRAEKEIQSRRMRIIR